MSTKITKANLIRDLLAAGYQRAESTLRKKTVAELEALLADWTCGGCDNGEHCGACECCEQPAEAAEQPEKADYVVSWRGNYNTVFAPAAELLATSTTLVWTVNVSTMLKETHIAGPETDVIATLLVGIEEEAVAALRVWQKTLDRKDATDMEKFNQNRSFLAGYLAAVAQEHSGAKKMPVVAFARDMGKALRPEALTAGAAARKEA